jgi:hypothetical protein
MFAGFANATGDESNSARSTVKGIVIDQNSGESLAGAEICILGTDIKVYSDLDGNFEISNLTPGTYNIVISYISYNKSLVEDVKLSADCSKKLEVMLKESE